MWRFVFGCCCCWVFFFISFGCIFLTHIFIHRVSIWWLPCFMTWLVLSWPVLPCFALPCLASLVYSLMLSFISFWCVSLHRVKVSSRMCAFAGSLASFVRMLRSFARIKKCKIQSEHTRKIWMWEADKNIYVVYRISVVEIMANMYKYAELWHSLV